MKQKGDMKQKIENARQMLAAYVLSVVVCVVGWYLICLCFEWNFKLRAGIGVYVIVFLIKQFWPDKD